MRSERATSSRYDAQAELTHLSLLTAPLPLRCCGDNQRKLRSLTSASPQLTSARAVVACDCCSSQQSHCQHKAAAHSAVPPDWSSHTRVCSVFAVHSSRCPSYHCPLWLWFRVSSATLHSSVRCPVSVCCAPADGCRPWCRPRVCVCECTCEWVWEWVHLCVCWLLFRGRALIVRLVSRCARGSALPASPPWQLSARRPFSLPPLCALCPLCARLPPLHPSLFLRPLQRPLLFPPPPLLPPRPLVPRLLG